MSDKWPGKELELPAVVAMPSFATRTLFVEKDRIRADAIAAQQLRVLKKHYGGKLWLTDVKELFLQMRDC